MKPIKLVIKGLNSFIEEQTVDFEELTQYGLFGIFGPTGSGKSTILDGITLALYGDLARKSSNYINTNCNELSVSYEFQISGAVSHIYTVSRQFKRDKHTGNPKTHAASVVEYTPEGPKVLAEGATQVTKTCKEILGLSLEDFTRTVVLPQGKFSEFLKLEGKNRREMLERLFNLQEYGDELTLKLSREINKQKTYNNQLIGELKGYDEVSEDKLKEGKMQLEESGEKLKALKAQEKEAEKQFKESEEIWNLQKEMTSYMIRKKELQAEKPKILEKEEKAARGESALRIAPHLTAYENTEKGIAVEKENIIKLTETTEALAKKKEELEEKFKQLTKQKDEKLPVITEKAQKLQVVIEDNNEAADMEEELIKIQQGLLGIEEKMAAFLKAEKTLEKTMSEEQQNLQKLQEEEISQRVDESLRSHVQQGLMINQQYEMENNKLKENKDRLIKLEEEKEKLKPEVELLKEKLAGIAQNLKSQESQQEALKTPPYTQEEMMKKQEELISLKERWTRYTALETEIQQYKEKMEQDTNEKKKIATLYETQKNKVEELKEKLEEAKMANMAFTLKQHLHTGDHCPVCGNRVQELVLEQKPELLGLKEAEETLKKEEELLDQQATSLNKLELQQNSNKQACEKLEKEEAPLKELFAKTTVEKAQEALETSITALKNYEESKKKIEGQLNTLKEERLTLEKLLGQKETLLLENDKQQTRLKEENDKQQQLMMQIKERLEALKKLIGGASFTAISQEIQEKDKKREELAQKISTMTLAREEKNKEKEELQSKISKYKASYQRGLAQFDEKQKNRENYLQRVGIRLKEVLSPFRDEEAEIVLERENLVRLLESYPILKSQLEGKTTYSSILDTIGEENENKVSCKDFMEQYPLAGQALIRLEEELDRLRKSLQQQALEISNAYDQIDEARKQSIEAYDAAMKKLIEVKTKLQELERRLEEEKATLLQHLAEEEMTIEDVKTHLLPREEIEKLKESITSYKEECSKLAGAMENASGKLAGRTLSPEKWQEIQEALQRITDLSEAQNEAYIKLETVVKSMEIALEKLGKLREEKEKVDHKLAILADLDKLFKGKRFVEYVASTRLKYISLEASKKLQEITCGNYGLEVDEDGRFIIRDYKNGGAQRDASTLSGGETFLASLALALALSAEIQLKGTAPLELFFLDEGFGTLDDELLDVVMSALEKIHHDKLKIGIISHVEAIKNRMPIKLILTPAEAGRGGTKIKLERS